MTQATEACDVVIVGAGPTGLTAAHLCGRVGLTWVVLERRSGPQRAPAAHAVNARTFEIWRQAGVAMEPILAAAADPADAGAVHWVTRLGGEVIGSLPYERQGDEMLAITPTPLRNLSQHKLEPLLLPPAGDVRYSHAWAGATQRVDGVSIEVDGPDGRYAIEARYLLGADGASSPVRRWLGIEPIGPRTIRSFLMIHLAGDLRPLVGDDRGVLYFVADPHSGGVFVAHDIAGEFVYMHGWDPEAEPVESFTPERCRQLVIAAMEPPGVDFEVVGTSTWHMSAQIAERYGAGRAFLVGDAAHRFPPTGGLGLNTGVADAHNLVWKLAAVEAGWAPADLLASYEAERRPVAVFNGEQSLHNALKMIEVDMAMGTVGGDPDTSSAVLAERLADPVARAEIEAAIAAQAIHFDLLGLQLGHVYDQGVVPDGTAAAPLDEPARDYVPSTRPGGRLPHAWIGDGRSTLDLVDPRVPTVLHCVGAAVPDWAAASTAVPTVTVAVGATLWEECFGLAPTACLVVRPDQHIAFRGPLTDAGVALTALFAR